MRIDVADSLPLAESSADILLLPGRAAFLPATATLLIGDVHLGKAATFRRAGIAVPEGSAQADLARLERLVATTKARRLRLSPRFPSLRNPPPSRLLLSNDDSLLMRSLLC